MFKKILAAATLVVVTLALGGCGSVGSFDRSVLNMPPAPAVAASSATAPAIVIRSITDDRTFEVAPRNPSTPSLGPDGGDAGVQARAIGRKRSGFGQAFGDVLLAPGQTVEDLMRQHIVAAFAQGGVRVVDESAATPQTPRVDVHIDRFWAWLHPAFMIHQNVHIEARFVVAGAEPVVATGHYDGEGPLPPDRVWIQMFETALTAFRGDLAARARQAPFTAPGPPSS